MDDFKYSRVQDESKQANGTASREDDTKRPTVSIAMEPLSSPKNSTLQAHDEDGSGNGGSYVSAQEGGYERVKDTHANFNHTTIGMGACARIVLSSIRPPVHCAARADWFSDITKFRRRMKQEREQVPTCSCESDPWALRRQYLRAAEQEAGLARHNAQQLAGSAAMAGPVCGCVPPFDVCDRTGSAT